VTRLLTSLILLAACAGAQVDQQRASEWFKEIDAVCEREGGRLWGISLCGPIAIVDASTKTIATNQPAPAAPQPAYFGFANTALEWGGARWTTLVWRMVPAEAQSRTRMFLHELFHRIQPQLGFMILDGQNDHLDTLEGRYWMQLEWRALSKALGASGDERVAALRDALSFRAERRRRFPGAAENERPLENNEGLAQYTGTVVAAASAADAVADAIAQLKEVERTPSFVRTFGYPSGAAYGLLLDAWSPGWTRRVKPTDDLAELVATVAKTGPGGNAQTAASRYDGPALRQSEERRDAELQLRLAELRRRFIEGPVLALPAGKSASFSTAGMTPIPGAGTIYPTYRTSSEWGSLEAANVLVAADRSKLTVPAPAKTEGTTIEGEGWKLTIAPGWVVKPGERKGDFVLARER
jgi:hypothetical protein